MLAFCMSPPDGALHTLGASLQLPANTLLFRSDGIHVATVDASGQVSLKTIIIGRGIHLPT